MEIKVFHREKGVFQKEQVYGEKLVSLVYGDGLWSKLIGSPLRYLTARWSLVSRLYGALQRRSSTKKQIVPFISAFGLDASEFEKHVEEFTSFDDFFTRKLRVDARPIAPGEQTLVCPADGRCLCYPDGVDDKQLFIKGRKLPLIEIVGGDISLAKRFLGGAIFSIRLAPPDYHRYHFPCDCTPKPLSEIKGSLYSVNPLAMRKNYRAFTSNKKALTLLKTKRFGEILHVAVGATCVGTIHQTFMPNEPAEKGEEMGYFSFGGSQVLLFFQPGKVVFDTDLISRSKQHIETLCQMGHSIGLAKDLYK